MFGYQFKNKKNTDNQIGIRLGIWNVSSLCSRGTEVAEELKKRKVDICGLQKVRLRGQGARFIGVKKDTSYGGRKIMLKSVVDIYKEGVKE